MFELFKRFTAVALLARKLTIKVILPDTVLSASFSSVPLTLNPVYSAWPRSFHRSTAARKSCTTVCRFSENSQCRIHP